MPVIKTVLAVLIFLISVSSTRGEATAKSEKPELSIEMIMRDPKWIGPSPRNIGWSDDSKWLYFYWNPEQADSDSLYVLSRDGGRPRKVTLEEQESLPARSGHYNRNRSRKLYEKSGDIFLYDIRSKTIRQITNTIERESNPQFTHDEKIVIFKKNNNLFSWQIDNGFLKQLTDFRKKKNSDQSKNDHERWLEEQELRLMRTLKERKEKKERDKENREAIEPSRPLKIFLNGSRLDMVALSPHRDYVTFAIRKEASDVKKTIIPSYVTESGFTEDISARSKVGRPQDSYRFGIYDISNDTVYYVNIDSLPGIFDKPKYLSEYQSTDSPDDSTVDDNEQEGPDIEKQRDKEKPRTVSYRGPYWSDDGRSAVIELFSQDSKDRWITLLDLSTGELDILDHQHDDAWIGGPGIRGWRRQTSVGWLPDNQRIWFQSEETGYSHLYTVDVGGGKKIQLTRGKFEIRSVSISKDKKSFYFTSNEVHPGERHLYRMPLDGGQATKITSMIGRSDAVLSPDEKQVALIHSCSNRPEELFLMKNKAAARARKITNSLSDEFAAYPWRDPEIVTFEASDGAKVYARLYRPEAPAAKGPAVIFVHGAGYIQNVHKWWSHYFREYMFHNFLADNGYTVLDIDYRGSAGYGRDWRTAIYRYMGDKDLSDQVDGAAFLVQNYDVDSTRIGIYGGSYGGFITLMAMFTKPGIFAAGAALRPVSDWAHYNHGYTSNILNLPQTDSLAYLRSSPIYHAEGLQGALLICHGMIDSNVHFQDVVRLAQRLIELGKENWELAVYPLEGHGFKEPSSWTDEYRRIFKLFEDNLR